MRQFISAIISMLLPDVLGEISNTTPPPEEECATSLQNHLRDTKELVATSYISARRLRIYHAPVKIRVLLQSPLGPRQKEGPRWLLRGGEGGGPRARGAS